MSTKELHSSSGQADTFNVRQFIDDAAVEEDEDVIEEDNDKDTEQSKPLHCCSIHLTNLTKHNFLWTMRVLLNLTFPPITVLTLALTMMTKLLRPCGKCR